MKYIRQFGIILAFSFLGEGLRALILVPVPASIYGLVLLFAGLMLGLIKVESVRGAGMFLIEAMPLMFIPTAVGLLDSWGILAPVVIPFAVITVLSTAAVMAVSGRVTQAVMRRGKSGEAE